MSRLENLPRIAASSVKSKSWNYIHYYFLNQDISEALSKYARGALLDLGCGNKPYEGWYKPLSTSQVGCDIIQSDKHIVDVICPVTELAFPDEMFDTVFCTQVLEHV